MLRPPALRAARAFTLIEVLVALMILSVMATLCWKGLDGILKSREIADGGLKRSLRLQSVMQQWTADLNAVVDTGAVQALQFDGAALRMTRQAAGGVQVVVWALRSGRWVRWAGEPVTSLGPLKDQWARSYAFQGRESGSLAALKGVSQWQVYFWRGTGPWSNAQSSAGTSTALPSAAAAAASGATGAVGAQGNLLGQANSREPLPYGVRTVLSLGDGSGFSGNIVRDVVMAAQPNQ
jgi:general secretion pathway protein J